MQMTLSLMTDSATCSQVWPTGHSIPALSHGSKYSPGPSSSEERIHSNPFPSASCATAVPVFGLAQREKTWKGVGMEHL